jgi:hypothetical protein
MASILRGAPSPERNFLQHRRWGNSRRTLPVSKSASQREGFEAMST